MKRNFLLCAMLTTSTAGICGQVDEATLAKKTATIAIAEVTKPVVINITPVGDLHENSIAENTELADVNITGQNAGDHNFAAWFTEGASKQTITGNDDTQAVITSDDDDNKTLSVKLTGDGATNQTDDKNKTILLTNNVGAGANMHVVFNGEPESVKAGKYTITLSAGEWQE